MDKTKKDIISRKIIEAVNGNTELAKAFVAAEDATPWVVGGLTVWSTAGYMKKGW